MCPFAVHIDLTGVLTKIQIWIEQVGSGAFLISSQVAPVLLAGNHSSVASLRASLPASSVLPTTVQARQCPQSKTCPSTPLRVPVPACLPTSSNLTLPFTCFTCTTLSPLALLVPQIRQTLSHPSAFACAVLGAQNAPTCTSLGYFVLTFE